ncbi:MAG: biotin/lipoyl-binding protein, partial [Corynebacterium sp.]|nr:biotin/lipoyl-binding protein [Corynebacterium sp.]
VVGTDFDPMLAKLIVTGEDRDQALTRARRALDEYGVEGLPTVIPFHRAVLDDDAFTGDSLDVYTRWIEEEWDNQLPAATDAEAEAGADEPVPSRRIAVEGEGRRVVVRAPGDLVGTGGTRRRTRKNTGRREVKVSGDTAVAPMQGTVVTVLVEEGTEVAEGDPLLVIEAMKMENSVKAHKAGTVQELGVAAGDGVTKSQPLLKIL